MFRGENKVTLDAKGRLAMPARYRAEIADDAAGRLVVTIDHADRCLLVYPLPTWEDVERKLAKLPTMDPQARALQRLMIGHATDVELDAQGRLLIPPNLRDYAGLTRDVVLSGQGVRFELWDEAAWVAQRDAAIKLHQDGKGCSEALSLLSF